MSKQAELAVRFNEWQAADRAVLAARHRYLNHPTKQTEKTLKRALREERRTGKRYRKYRDKLRNGK